MKSRKTAVWQQRSDRVHISKLCAYIANMGDSRAYLFRDGALRKDNGRSYICERACSDKGVITEEEAENHKQKNVITRALGAESIDRTGFLPDGCVAEMIYSMLCSDGLYGEVTEEDMLRYSAREVNMNDVCVQLVDEAHQTPAEEITLRLFV